MTAPISPTDGHEWVFDTDRADGGIQIDQIQSAVPELYPGVEITLSCLFYRSPVDRTGTEIETGGTLGTETGFTLGGSTGAVVGATPDPNNHIDRYEAVRKYTEYSGRYNLLTALDGTVRISDHTPSSAPIPSIIVHLSPGPANESTPGLWVVIDDVDDSTVRPADVARLELTVVLLSRGDEYADRSALKSAIGSDL
jgi:hypothetical protein